MHKLGIGWAMIHSGKGAYRDQDKDLRNVGTIGCFLSHRNLLSKLSKMDVSDDYGHLILEDDIELPKQFLMPGDRWHSVKKEIPDDWDMVFLGIKTPVGDRISKNVLKLKNQIVNSGNWGTHAYIVRHKSVNKVLGWLKYMIDSVDCQFNMMFDIWNVYCTSPFIILLNDEMAKDSSIVKM
jgi:GR25 family glycosyltransferase involved in LPS biosynthesis